MKEFIDWTVFEKTGALTSFATRKWRGKHIANIGPIGEVMYRRKHRETAECPRCIVVNIGKQLNVRDVQTMKTMYMCLFVLAKVLPRLSILEWKWLTSIY